MSGGAVVEVAAPRSAAEPGDSGWPTVMLLEGPGDAELVSEQADELRSAGLAVARVCPEPNGDRQALAALERTASELTERAEVDAERLAVLGFGELGTLAFLFACHSTRVAAAGLVQAPLVYARLDAQRPSQPLELALNIGCPLFAAFGLGDEALDPAHVDRMEAVLSQFAKPFDIVRLPGARGRFYDRTHAGFGPTEASEFQQALTAFLRTSLELE